MRYISTYVFALFIFFGLASQASNLRGVVFLSLGQYYFTDSDSRSSYLLKATNEEASEALSRLKSFDTLLGTGSIGPNRTVWLESVDFVALRRLIGIWKGPATVVNFVDYTHVDFHLPKLNQSVTYTYALAPAEGDSWRIFFTDTSSVALGSLSVNKSKAQIEVYDSQTGEVSQRYDLEKINP